MKLLTAFLMTITISLSAQDFKKKSHDSYTFQIFQNTDLTWGYSVFVDGKKKINQPTIPGMSGNKGFTTKDAAQKVAEQVVEKLRKGETRPTLKKEELEKLNVL